MAWTATKVNKYRNIKIVVDGVKFDSKKEYRRNCELELLQKAGKIKNLERQVKFTLLGTFKDNQGKTERGVSFIIDFAYQEGRFKIAEDVKSVVTKKDSTYIIKRKLFKAAYPEYIFRET